tara:strand:- start:107 stop:703 length:597 start_codon:yes stop_codon:yes gene_type:complete
MDRPQSEAGTFHLPDLSLGLVNSPRPETEPVWSPRIQSPMPSPRTASLNSLAFEPLRPQLSASAVNIARAAIEDAEDELASMQSAKDLLHAESTAWAKLNDDTFAEKLRDGHRRLKQLEYEGATVQRRVAHKRELAAAMEAAMGAQVESAKRARLFERRRAETREANKREADALASLAQAKSTEGALKKALLHVGQQP